MASVAVLSLGIGIGSGIGIGFGIFHTPNPCDSMKLSIVENSKVPANQTACVGLTNDGHFVKLTPNSEACNNACEAYHHNTARNTALSRSGRRKLANSITHQVTATPFVENAIVENTLFKTEIAETVLPPDS